MVVEYIIYGNRLLSEIHFTLPYPPWGEEGGKIPTQKIFLYLINGFSRILVSILYHHIGFNCHYPKFDVGLFHRPLWGGGRLGQSGGFGPNRSIIAKSGLNTS